MESQQLKDAWAKELLGPHLQEIQAAQKALKDAVDTANSSLKKSRIARLVAAEVGHPKGSIIVDPAGTILITFKASSKTSKVEVKKTPKTKMKTPKVIEVKKAKTPKVKADTGKREWKSDLPTLEVLRERAANLGVDITKYGRARAKICSVLDQHEAMDAINAEAREEAKRKKAVKTDVGSVGQSSDADSAKTKRQTVIRRRRKKNVVDLKTAAAKTESVDLDQILEG